MSEYNPIVINWAGRAKRAGLSFFIVNLGVTWELRPNSPVLLWSCPKRVLLFFFRRELPHKNGATSEVVPSLKGYYLSSTSSLQN